VYQLRNEEVRQPENTRLCKLGLVGKGCYIKIKNKGYMKEVIEGMISKTLKEISTFEDIKANHDGDGRTFDLMLMMSKRQLKDLYTMLDLA